MKEQDLHLQEIIQNLHRNRRYARFLLAISRFKHDIDANYVEFCSKIQYWKVQTSHSSNFDAEKRFFYANTTSAMNHSVKEPGFHHYLCSQLAAGWSR